MLPKKMNVAFSIGVVHINSITSSDLSLLSSFSKYINRDRGRHVSGAFFLGGVMTGYRLFNLS